VQQAVARLESGSTSMRTMPPGSADVIPRIARVVDAALEKRMTEAVLPWTERSKGRIEARVFEVNPPLVPGNLGKTLLRTVPLACLEKAVDLRAERTTSDAVWGALFAAASNGGAYSSGLGGAYGRPAAWRSLAALAGVAEGTAIPEVAERASRCAFLM